MSRPTSQFLAAGRAATVRRVVAKRKRIAELAIDGSRAAYLSEKTEVSDFHYIEPLDDQMIRHASEGLIWAHRCGRTPADDCRSLLVAIDWATALALARDGKPADPVKLRARQEATKARLRGVLVRQPCESCGGSKAEMHHDDYARPLDIRWLCRTCHENEHRGESVPQPMHFVLRLAA